MNGTETHSANRCLVSGTAEAAPGCRCASCRPHQPHRVSSPASSGSIFPAQMQHLIEENAELRRELARRPKAFVEWPAGEVEEYAGVD